MDKQTITVPTPDEIVEQFRRTALPDFLVQFEHTILPGLISQVRQAVCEEMARGSQATTVTSDKEQPLITIKQLSKELQISEPTLLRYRKKESHTKYFYRYKYSLQINGRFKSPGQK